MLSPLTPLLLMLVGLVTGAPHWNKTSDSAEWDPIPHSHSQSQHIARSEREVFAETSTRALLNIVFDDEYRIVFDEEKLKGFYTCLCSNDSERCDFTLVNDTTIRRPLRDVTVGVVTQHKLSYQTQSQFSI
ncbi:hypothetical protein EGW08_022953 [Elysia chlorotica]|uniref:Uncharacterized protein n=1 Tax=Elysia chlorotica TaxID=188477 RepID=A0A3S1AQM3_ELYCH|nr:hypothetical protein EGW08_022953 [Elysia chlorotica]